MSLWSSVWFRWTMLVIVLGGGGYEMYRWLQPAAAAPQYGFATVQKTTIVASVKGTGQISGSRVLEIKPKVSSTVSAVLSKVAENVKAGQPIYELERTTALKNVRDAVQSLNEAKISLDSSQLSLKKAKQPTDPLVLLQALDALNKAERDLQTLKAGPTDFELKQAQADVAVAERNIKMTPDGSLPQVVRDALDNSVLTLQSAGQVLDKSIVDADIVLGVDNGLPSVVYGKYISLLNTDKKNSAVQAYAGAKIAVQNASLAVKGLKTFDETRANIEQASTRVDTAIQTVTDLMTLTADALSFTPVASDFTQTQLDNLKSMIDTQRTNLSSKSASILSASQAVDKANDSYESAKLSYQKSLNSLEDLKQGADASEIMTAQERVTEAQTQYDKLKAGPDPVDLEIAQNNVEQRQSSLKAAQNKLADVQEALNDYSVIAPIDGQIVELDAGIGTDVGSGSVVAKLMTAQKVAVITLNEVDAALVKEGQKATLTFDAIDNFSLTGEVIQVDPVGTVSQGVVNYTIHVAFESDDVRLKSGMSVSVSIITSIKPDVLAVPNAAVKTQGDVSYVETLSADAMKGWVEGQLLTSAETPKRVPVEVGSSNDTETEIISGLNENDKVITQTITAQAKAAAATAATTRTNSLLPIGGGGGTFRQR